MADKYIGDLTSAEDLFDSSLFAVMQNGATVSISGAVLKTFIQQAAKEAALGLLKDGEALVLKGSPLVIDSRNYGTTLPETAVEGQLFFLLG